MAIDPKTYSKKKKSPKFQVEPNSEDEKLNPIKSVLTTRASARVRPLRYAETMINNLQFYGIAVLVGFIISLAVRKDDEVPKWNVWTVILFPVCWALIGMTMIITVGDGRFQGIKDILFYFDAETLLGSDGYRKGQLLVMLIFPIYFTLVFGLFWRLKNKHISGSERR